MASGGEVAGVVLEEGPLPRQRAGVGLNSAAGASLAVIVDAAIFGSSSGSELADGAADRVFFLFPSSAARRKPKQEELNGTRMADPPAVTFGDLRRFSWRELASVPSTVMRPLTALVFGTFCC